MTAVTHSPVHLSCILPWSSPGRRARPGRGRTAEPSGEPLRDRSDDDRKLIEAIKGGDPAALQALYDRRAGVVLALCRRILGDIDSEEALLDTFVQLWEQADRYDAGRSSPLAYLMTIARSRAIDRLRARRRRPVVPLEGGDQALLDSLASVTRDDPSPLDDVLLAERRELVQGALRELPETQRQPVELSFYEGYTHREIAERLDWPLGTVKTRIRQGLLRLRDALVGPRGGGGDAGGEST